VIKSFLNLCLVLFLDTLACMVAFIAAVAVVWAALCGARWVFARLQNAVTALMTRLRRKEMCAHATR
jgi:hypothetical protein